MSRNAVWTAIRDTLSFEIAGGRYLPEDKLPTESELSSRFGVHRHTVRRAIADLVSAGVLRTQQGAGVFVVRKPTQYTIGHRVRFHQNLKSIGQTPSRKSLFRETRAADLEEAKALKISPGVKVHVNEGLRMADGQPISVYRCIFPAFRFPNMLDAFDRTGSVTAAFAAHGIDDYVRAWTEVNSVRASKTIAGHLGLRPGAPVLRLVSINTEQNGQPIEYGRTWFSGDHVTLTIGQRSGD